MKSSKSLKSLAANVSAKSPLSTRELRDLPPELLDKLNRKRLASYWIGEIEAGGPRIDFVVDDDIKYSVRYSHIHQSITFDTEEEARDFLNTHYNHPGPGVQVDLSDHATQLYTKPGKQLPGGGDVEYVSVHHVALKLYRESPIVNAPVLVTQLMRMYPRGRFEGWPGDTCDAAACRNKIYSDHDFEQWLAKFEAEEASCKKAVPRYDRMDSGEWFNYVTRGGSGTDRDLRQEIESRCGIHARSPKLFFRNCAKARCDASPRRKRQRI